MEENFTEITKKKGKKGLIVTTIILSVFLLGSLGCLYYGYTKYNSLKDDNSKLNTDYEEVNKELSDVKKDMEETKKENDKEKLKETESSYSDYITYDFDDGKDAFNIYAVGYMSYVIGVNGGLYLVEHGGGGYTAINCSNEIAEGAKFKKGEYTCEDSQGEEDITAFARDLNIKEKDVRKVVLNNCVGTTDAQYDVFIILKSGKTMYYHPSGYKRYPTYAFKNYNVKDVKETRGKCGDTSCKPVYVLTLKDGSTKKVNVLD